MVLTSPNAFSKEIYGSSNLDFKYSSSGLNKIRVVKVQHHWVFNKMEGAKFCMIILDVKVALLIFLNDSMESRY